LTTWVSSGATLGADATLATRDSVEPVLRETIIGQFTWRAVDWRRITFSWNGKHFAYVWRRSRYEDQGPGQIIVDGVPGEKYEDVTDPEWERTGSRLAYAAKRGAKWFVVVNGVEGEKYDGIEIAPRYVLFSPDGSRLAYVGVRATGQDSGQMETKQFVVVDGVERKGAYDYVSDLHFSQDDRRFGCCAKRAGKPVLILDGAEREIVGYDSLRDLVFSPDGKHVAYVASRAKAVSEGEPTQNEGAGDTVILDGQELKAHDSVGLLRGCFSADGEHFAYVAANRATTDSALFQAIISHMNDKNTQEQVEGMVEQLRKSSPQLFSKTKEYVVKDGVEGPHYDEIDQVRGLIWGGGPHGERFGYTAFCESGVSEPNDVGVVDGTEIRSHDHAAYPCFSPDGKRLAYAAKIGKKTLIVLDGVTGPEYDGVSVYTMAFSPDSRHFVYWGRRGATFVLVADGQEIRAYDNPWNERQITSTMSEPITFDTSDSFHTHVSRGENIVRVQGDWPQPEAH